MKKTILKVLVTFCVAIAMILGSCGDESDDGGGSGGNGGGGGIGGGGVNSGLNGTWVCTYTYPDTGVKLELIKIVLNNGSITESSLSILSDSYELSETRKGTYSTSGNNITINFTQVNGNASGSYGLSPSQWYTEQEVRTPFIQYFVDLSGGPSGSLDGRPIEELVEEDYDEMESAYLKILGFGSFTRTYTLNGNTLTITSYSGVGLGGVASGLSDGIVIFTRQ